MGVDLNQVRKVIPQEALRALPTPEPSAGLDHYEACREAALASDPRKRDNYKRYMASKRRNADVEYLPIKLDIENVSRCNYRCSMCVVSEWPGGKRAEDMSPTDFERLIDEQYGLVEIKLQGLGEPTMQGADFFRMIAYARARHIWVRTTTNASRLHLKTRREGERFIYQDLVDADPNEVQISIDGATADVFESIRHGSQFKRVVENCRKINDYARAEGKRITKMWTVVQRNNAHQLFDLVDLAHEMGFRDQTFALSLSNWGQDDWRARNDSVTVEEEFDVDMAQALVEKGRALGIRVSFWHSTDKYDTRHKDKLCPWPFERATVASDGRTVPCCTIGTPDAYEIGKGSGKSFTELWTSDEFKAFRQAHLSGDLPDVCRHCYVDVPKVGDENS